MEGHIYNAAITHSKQEEVTRSVSPYQESESFESKVSNMDTAEFLWMSGCTAVIGTSIYLMSFLMI